MQIGLVDVDSHNFPNLPLMKISAYHKAKGDQVEFINYLKEYDKVYISKVFGDEYSKLNMTVIQAKEIIMGGTGFNISVENDKEIFNKETHKNLPDKIEHIYPDYSLYPELTKDTAYGFLTRGCSNNCDFCIVSKKEGCISHKVADLSEFWDGQKHITLLDPNILACKDRVALLQQLIDSNAYVDFNQGLDARFITPEIANLIAQCKVKLYHFAFDFMRNEKAIIDGLNNFVIATNYTNSKCNAYVYILTNFNTTLEQDLYRINLVREIGLDPYVMIYRKNKAPKILRHLQRWCNSKFIYRVTPDFLDYKPGKYTMKELYKI